MNNKFDEVYKSCVRLFDSEYFFDSKSVRLLYMEGTFAFVYSLELTFPTNYVDMTKFLNDILGEIDSFVGIIYTDNNLKDATSALHVNEDKFTVFIGTDEIMLGAFASGFTSLVGTTLNFLPKIAQTIYEAVKVGSIKDAKTSQDLLKNVLEAIYRHGEWLPAVKAAMNILTPVNVGPVRDPLVPIWQDKVSKMKSDLQQFKVV